MIRALAITAALLAGCADGSCKKLVDQMAERLGRAGGWTISSVAEVDLPEVPRNVASTEIKSAAEIAFHHDGVELWGRRVSDAELARELERMKAMRARRPAGAPAAILFAVDQRAPIATVREVAARFPEPDELLLVVAISGERPLDRPVARVQAAIEAITTSDPSQRATIVAEAVEKALGDCKPATAVFEKMGGVTPSERVRMLTVDLPAAVARCSCKKVDVPMLEGMLLSIFGAYKPPRGWIPLDRAKLASAANAAALL